MRVTHSATEFGLGPALDTRQRAVLHSADEAERRAAAALPSDDPLDPKRLLRVQATGPELRAQPAVVQRNWLSSAERLAQLADRLADLDFDRVVLVGAGDSLAVMHAARLALELMLGVVCEPVQAFELAFFQSHNITPRTVVIALSSSGETTRTVQSLLLAQAAGAFSIALTNRPASTLAEQSNETVLVDATRVGWPTQSSTAPLALLLRLATLVGLRRGQPAAADLASELDTLPELMSAVLERLGPAVRRLVAEDADTRMVHFVGAGPNWGSAIVGAAKVKECTPDHALATQLEEFHHYNSVKAGEPVWLFAPAGLVTARAQDTLYEARRLGGHVHVVTSEGGEADLAELAASVSALPAVSDPLCALLYFLPAQLVGYELALAKFATARDQVRA